MTRKEMYLSWLNDAYSLETDIANTLESQVDDFDEYPDMKDSIKKHLDETKEHAKKLKNVIEKMGGDVSELKSGIATIMGKAKGVTAETMHDKVVKNAIADYATEYTEIGSYKSLIEAAKIVGDEESVKVFEDILEEEYGMADTIEESLPDLVTEYLVTHEE
ncbi:MAG: DUF892 family protein [Patescibacteria group bacterium]